MKQKAEWLFDAGCALSRDLYWVHAAASGSGKAKDAAASRMVFYQHQAANPWSYNDLEGWPVQSLCFSKGAPSGTPSVCALSREGEVEYYSSEGAEVEQIADAGTGPDKPGYGPVARIREIGAHLYVCGHGGQVYRREAADWVHCGTPMRQPADGGRKVEATDATGEAWAEAVKEVGDLSDINGHDEQFLYTVGANGYIAFFTGVEWIDIPKVSAAPLNFILAHPNPQSMIWIAGNRGTLLKGNADVGFFSVIASKHFDIDFHSVALFQERLFVGASDGIYEIVDYRLQKLPVSDAHALGRISSVEARDGVLWALSARKLVRYDGAAWEVFESPY